MAIVDDHQLLRELLKAYVQVSDTGCRIVLEADNGRSFVGLLEALSESQRPQLVLLDINMSQMDGYETISWLRENCPEIKIVILSMFFDQQTIVRCLKLGANAYLAKGVNVDELLFTIRTVVEKGEYFSQEIGNIVISGLKGQSPENSGDIELTSRETQFLRMACQELTYKEIAEQMSISPRTVEIYRDRLFKKLNVGSRVGLALYAVNKGITKP
ncbi:MAG: response regulator transcription factor [Puia sp.]|nr:response regulator transcription factor [Puia sp.]